MDIKLQTNSLEQESLSMVFLNTHRARTIINIVINPQIPTQTPADDAISTTKKDSLQKQAEYAQFMHLKFEE